MSETPWVCMRILLKVYRKIWSCSCSAHKKISKKKYMKMSYIKVMTFMILRLHKNFILKNFSRSVLEQNVKSKHNRDFPVIVGSKCSCDTKMSADNYRVY